MKKVLIAQFHHESNGFSPVTSNENDFKVLYEEEIFQNIKENDSISGIIQTLQAHNIECIPTVFMRAVPNGEVDEKFFKKIYNQFINLINKYEKSIDAITLALHGSMRIRNLGAAEPIILKALRETFPKIPIFVAMDMHASLSQSVINHCNAIVGYKTAPHIDCTQTGEHIARLTVDYLQTGIIPSLSWLKIPILIAGEKSATDSYPMTELIGDLIEMETKPNVLAASYLLGFPWSDHFDNTVSVCVVSREPADHLAQILADNFFNRRNEFKFVSEAYSPSEAISKAIEYTKNKEYPIYISDSGDNPTAGASSDNTNFLKLILDRCELDALEKPVLYTGFYDPSAVKQCINKEGQQVHLSFGAFYDKESSKPISQEVFVKKMIKNYNYNNINSGSVVLINILNIDIIIVEKHIGFTDTHLFIALGLNPLEHPIIICKLGYLTPAHLKIAKQSIFALTDGNTHQRLENIHYENIIRPVFPVDEI